MRLLLEEENGAEKNKETTNLGTILIPISFALVGFVVRLLFQILRRRRERGHQLHNEEIINLDDRQIKDTIVILCVLPHDKAHSDSEQKEMNSSNEQSIENVSNPNKSSICSDNINAQNESLTCHICLETFSIDDKVALPLHKTVCDHVFHEKCITFWLQRSNTCPCCRHQYITTPKDEENTNVFSRWKSFRNKDFVRKAKIETTKFCQIHGLVQMSDNNSKDDIIGDEEDIKTVSLRSNIDLSI